MSYGKFICNTCHQPLPEDVIRAKRERIRAAAKRRVAGMVQRGERMGKPNSVDHDGVVEYKESHPRATLREIANVFNCSSSTVYLILRNNRVKVSYE